MENQAESLSDQLIHVPKPRRSTRARMQTDHYTPEGLLTLAALREDSDLLESLAVEEALGWSKNSEWKLAVQEEMQEIDRKEVFQLTELPKGFRRIRKNGCYCDRPTRRDL